MNKFLLFIFSFLLLTSCIKKLEDPSWIEIKEWQLLANSNQGALEGELTHNFTNAWVYADGQLVGVFELPVKLPLLLEGITEIRILPTVLNNGISATKKAYPFVQPYVIQLDLKRNETIVIEPVTKHYDEVQFWIEGFEDTSIKFEPDPFTSAANLVRANDPTKLKYGNYYGLIALNSIDSIYAGYTLENDPMYLPKQGKEVYLEIDYRSTNSLTTGVIEHSSSTVKYHPNIQINGQTPENVVWKKIYIDLKDIVTGTPSSEYYKISLIARLNEGGIDREVIIDNIKVLHF